MLRCAVISSLPLGPSTLTCCPCTCTLTPVGITTGCFPMRDIVASPRGANATPLALPNRAEHLAAQFLGPGPAVAHDALAGADHADAQPVEDRPQLGRPHVEPAAGTAGPRDVPDDALALRPVLQE